ncbi:histidine utilization repressor [Pseudomonas mangiferae]|uniref:Histidine utilization repressor n=1 Tax=Pseudomonas mangiferae TaxID=2593654 RepID=A0A553GVE4_9PSED|nr:histidine utilization repressor [Pseudomonas mangiferae]TRX73472.1 histidine utilization repressor [Pseudomonas mangiferae]
MDIPGPQPQYLRIKTHILAAIRDGALRPGDRIPAETSLAGQFGVSRMTVNRAIRELADAGVVQRFVGDGTYIAEPRAESPLTEIRNIAEEIRNRGHQYSARVVTLVQVSADEDIAQRLGLRLAEPVFHSLIVHCENEVPVQLEERHVNPALCPDYLEQDFLRITPNQHLTRTCPLTDVEHLLSARLPGPRERDLLGIAGDEPCLLLLRRTWSGGRLVSVARLWHPGSRYALRSHIHLADAGPGHDA